MILCLIRFECVRFQVFSNRVFFDILCFLLVSGLSTVLYLYVFFIGTTISFLNADKPATVKNMNSNRHI